MRACKMLALAGCLTLAACGGGRNNQAAQACSDEIANRLAGKTYTLDLKDLAAHAKAESADTLLLNSSVIIDKGLASEDKQGYDCRVRIDAKGTASVLYLQFSWNTDDLKKSEQ